LKRKLKAIDHKIKEKDKRLKGSEGLQIESFKKEKFIRERHRENLTNAMMVLNFHDLLNFEEKKGILKVTKILRVSDLFSKRCISLVLIS